MKTRIVLVLFFVLVSLVAFSEDRIVELDVRGNEKTKDFVVAQLIGYREGMVLDIEQLYIGKRALENSGLFRDVYISVVPVGRDYRLVVEVVEAATVYPYVGPFMAIGVGDRNVFGLGIDTYFGIRFFRFEEDRLWGFLPMPQLFWGGPVAGVRIPRLLGSQIDLSVQGFLFREVPWYNIEDFTKLSRVTLSSVYRFEPSAISLRLLYESALIDYSDDDSIEAMSTEGFLGPDDFNNLMIGVGYSYGDSANYERLRRNLYGSAAIDLGYVWDLSEENKGLYSRIYADIGYYHRLIAQTYLLSETTIAVTSFGTPPLTQRYFPGRDVWGDLNFVPRHYIEQTLHVGILLSGGFGLAMTMDQAVFIPKLYLKGIIGDRSAVDDRFVIGAAIGLGLRWNTPFGISVEPQIYLRERAQYFKFNIDF
ncbi:MAG: Uncharacterized protein XE05_0563 [Thermotogales bacterium 46_20]|nr:MAG: Uncharacterized protein XE05_0563 [Thermotogales bacterium 46_20]